MTVFGWDASHYDAPPAARDGIDVYTHKLTDGDHYYEDPEYLSAMTAARGLGIPVLGSYHVLHGRVSVTAQADWWVSRVRALTPWWTTYSGGADSAWMWQCDGEQFDYMVAPTIDEINAFGDAVCARADCPASSYLAYAPEWLYGTQLTRLRYRVWASDYGANPTGPYRTIYPGDTSIRWQAPVSPLFLQYGSRATIAGQTTCDANAYRGTLSSLIDTLNGGVSMSLTSADLAAIANIIWHGDIDSNARSISAGTALLALFDRPAPTIDQVAIATAAHDGAQTGVVDAAGALADAIVARLPAAGVGITKADVVDAVRQVFADAAAA